jgi:hypothetical protein
MRSAGPFSGSWCRAPRPLPNGNAGSRDHEGNRGGFVVLLGPQGGGDLSGGYAPSQQVLHNQAAHGPEAPVTTMAVCRAPFTGRSASTTWQLQVSH